MFTFFSLIQFKEPKWRGKKGKLKKAESKRCLGESQSEEKKRMKKKGKGKGYTGKSDLWRCTYSL